jgi:hypothetical protein
MPAGRKKGQGHDMDTFQHTSYLRVVSTAACGSLVDDLHLKCCSCCLCVLLL